MRYRVRPGTWVTLRSGHMGNTFSAWILGPWHKVGARQGCATPDQELEECLRSIAVPLLREAANNITAALMA